MLISVVSTFQDEIGAIAEVFDEGPFFPMITCDALPYHPADDGCLVSVWDAWTRFLRNLFLTCANGKVISTASAVYSPSSPMSEQNALTALRQATSVSGSAIVLSVGEPKWFIVSSASEIGSVLGLSNVAQIQSALAQDKVALGGGFYVQNPIADLQRIRNYVAHKSSAVAVGLTRGMSMGIGNVSEHLRERTRGGSNRFHDWCDGLVALAWDAAA